MRPKIRQDRLHYALVRMLFAQCVTVALLLGAMILSSAASWATTQRWIQTGGPEGVLIRALAIDPRNPETVYTSGEYAGALKSSNGGVSWSAINALSEKGILSLAVNPQNPATVYAGGGFEILKSTDGGGSWKTVYSSYLAPLEFRCFAFDPQDPATVYVGAYKGTIFKSTDGGDSWSYTSPEMGFYHVVALAIDTQSPKTVYAAIPGTAPGLHKSTDGGSSWSAVHTGLTDTEFHALAIDPQNPGTIYAGYGSPLGGGVIKSINRGASWSTINSGLANTGITALAVDPHDPTTVYAGNENGDVFKSSNGGSGWRGVKTGLTGMTVTVLATNPQNPAAVYAGTAGGIFKSSDSGDSWSTVNAGLVHTQITSLAIDPKDPATVYAGTYYGGVFKSINSCKNWSAVNAGLVHAHITALAIDPQNPGTIYAGYGSPLSGGVIKSINGGASWSIVNSGLASTGITALAINPQNPATVYAGTTLGSAVFKSNNGGASWSAVDTGLPNRTINDLAIDPQNPATVYAGTPFDGIFKSLNGGAIWSAVNAGLLNTRIQALAIDPQNPATLYAGSDRGIFKSINGGDSWSAVNTGLPNHSIVDLVLDLHQPSTLYAATHDEVFKSLNGGASWSAINTGLPDRFINVLAIDPQDSTTVYAGTDGSGVFVTTPVARVLLGLPAGGTISTSTLGPTDELVAGYATVTVNTGSAPYGTAVFSYTQNGVVVSEAGVPVSPPTRAARFFVDSRTGVSAGAGSGTINISTGFAAVNQGTADASLALKLRDGVGTTLAQGTVRLARGAHMAKFLDQLAPDFVMPPSIVFDGLGSLEITSDQPVSVLALRLTINQRGDLLMTTTPIADLGKPAPAGRLSFPQIADGGGYQTTIILMNTSNAAESGVVRFYGNDGAALAVGLANGGAAGSQFQYTIPAGGFVRLATDGLPAEANTGWARLTPDGDSAAPVSAAIFSYTRGTVLVTESGVAATTATTHARIYLDLTGGHDTGLAVVNQGNSPLRITATAYELDGVTPAGNGPGTVDLAPLGHAAKFAWQLIAGLPEGFTGVLDLRSADPFAALTLRSLYNERRDFLITTFPVADANQAPPDPLIFPQIADGGGYQTQIILLSTGGAASTVTVNYLGNDGSPITVGQRKFR